MGTSAVALAEKIRTIKGLRSSEADFSNHLRDLLTQPSFGLGLRPQQLQVDTANLPGSRRRPDIAVFETQGGQAAATPDHMVAVIELKRSDVLTRSLASVFKEKKDYIQPATRHFFLVDQKQVWRYDLIDHADAKSWTWDELAEPGKFNECFGVISAEELRLEDQLERFKQGRTRFGYLSIETYRKNAFIRTVAEVSETLQNAIEQLIEGPVANDLRHADELIDNMAKRWGEPVFDWTVTRRSIEFASAVDVNGRLTVEEIGRYEEEHDAFEAELRPCLYAVQIERNLLKSYAERLALGEQPSLLKPRFKNGKATPSGKAIASLAYETGALIMSRMLMVRFCEDHGLFTTRYISTGGILVFSTYAQHFQRRMQALLQETNRVSAQLFTHLFDPSLLDWALDRDDERLSHAILKAAYLLSRWDFKTAHGDILSGVYDRYLNTSRRRALGEVYTRPEVARYMLKLAGADRASTILDPACGTGTFLVEALVAELGRLRSRGLHRDVAALKQALSRLAGLDLNDFAIVLAQIQIIWHLIEALATGSAAEVRANAKALIPSIPLAGGWSSLHAFGQAFATASSGGSDGSQSSMHFAVRAGDGRRAAALSIPRKFQRLARSQYDVVVMNPPYVRSHRQGGADYRASYPEVAFGVTDLFVFFIYRALRQWVKPGGRLAVIVPLAVLDADYGSRLRAVLREFRLTHVVDLEALGRMTFHGIKRNTVILVVERSEPRAEDVVAVVTVPPSAYDERSDTIDFDQASVEQIPTRMLSQETFLPPAASMSPWLATIERCVGAQAPMLSKLKRTDLPILGKLARAPRLGSIAATAWTRRRDGVMRIEHSVPYGEDPMLWKYEMVAGVGLELGGSKAFAPTGVPIWRGQHIFPGGVAGESMREGFYDPAISEPKARKIYAYASLFTPQRLYAVRDIAQLPTACLVPSGAAFQNSAVLIQLTEDFPLNTYLLSRVPQWYAARVLRSTILQDFGCHWYKRTIPFLPIPENRSTELLDAIRDIGTTAIAVDSHLADTHAGIRAMLVAAPSSELRQLMLADHPCASGLTAEHIPETAVPIAGIRESGLNILTNDLLFLLTVPDNDLRTVLAYSLERVAVADPQAALNRDGILSTRLPLEGLASIAATVRDLKARDGQGEFETALAKLDAIVGRSLGLDETEIEYARSEMANDPILSRMRPMLRQRGIRAQGYAGDDDDDRYD